MGGVDIEITGVVRGYLPGRDNPLATVYVQDSVFWSESADNMELLKLYLPSPDEALRAAGQYIGRKVTRTLFLIGIMKAVGSIKVKGRVGKKRPPMPCLTNGRKRLHVGSMCMKILHVGKSGQRLHRTWLCFYEMKTQLKDAYDWAAKSYEIFNNKKGEDYNYTKMQRLYVEALGKRIRSDQKLNKQFGE